MTVMTFMAISKVLTSRETRNGKFYEVNITFLPISLVDGASHVIVTACPVTTPLFFKISPYRIAIMNEDSGKFVNDGMQQTIKKTIMKRTSNELLTCLYFTKSCFVACVVRVYAMM